MIAFLFSVLILCLTIWLASLIIGLLVKDPTVARVVLIVVAIFLLLGWFGGPPYTYVGHHWFH